MHCAVVKEAEFLRAQMKHSIILLCLRHDLEVVGNESYVAFIRRI